MNFDSEKILHDDVQDVYDTRTALLAEGHTAEAAQAGAEAYARDVASDFARLSERPMPGALAALYLARARNLRTHFSIA
jgi:hypothetical protein